MAYRFRRSDASVQDGVRRIAIEQIDRTISEIDDADLGADETVHQVRKRCKKLRGLVRLVRPAYPAYADENAMIRDAAAELSFLRDSEALISACDALAEHYRKRIDRAAFEAVRRRLTQRQKEIAAQHDMQARLIDFRDRMTGLQRRAAGWNVDENGFAKAIAGGLALTYGRGRRAMRRARKNGSTEIFHEWRKRVKYHGYHARLLSPAWPEAMRAHCDAADRLGDLLGNHHDLAVLRQTIDAEREAFGAPKQLAVFCGLIDERQASLSAESFALGDRLLAEPARALTARWEAYWTAWRGSAARRPDQ